MYYNLYEKQKEIESLSKSGIVALEGLYHVTKNNTASNLDLKVKLRTQAVQSLGLSLESFGMDGVAIALEEEQGFFKKVWEKIKAIFKAIWARIKGFFTSFKNMIKKVFSKQNPAVKNLESMPSEVMDIFTSLLTNKDRWDAISQEELEKEIREATGEEPEEDNGNQEEPTTLAESISGKGSKKEYAAKLCSAAQKVTEQLSQLITSNPWSFIYNEKFLERNHYAYNVVDSNVGTAHHLLCIMENKQYREEYIDRNVDNGRIGFDPEFFKQRFMGGSSEMLYVPKGMMKPTYGLYATQRLINLTEIEVNKDKDFIEEFTFNYITKNKDFNIDQLAKTYNETIEVLENAAKSMQGTQIDEMKKYIDEKGYEANDVFIMALQTIKDLTLDVINVEIDMFRKTTDFNMEVIKCLNTFYETFKAKGMDDATLKKVANVIKNHVN